MTRSLPSWNPPQIGFQRMLSAKCPMRQRKAMGRSSRSETSRPPTSTAGGITPRDTIPDPQRHRRHNRHPPPVGTPRRTHRSSGTNSTRIRELSSCSMRSLKPGIIYDLTACRSLQLSSSRSPVEQESPRRRPFREPPALYTSGWTSTTTSNCYTTFVSARTNVQLYGLENGVITDDLLY